MYQEGNEWEYKFLPLAISENRSDKVIDLKVYKNHNALIIKSHVFLGKHDSKFQCRRCLNSVSSQITLIENMQRCNQQQITAIKVSKESDVYWKKRFHKNPFYFGIYAVSEVDNEIDNSNRSRETTFIFKQHLVCNGYYIVSELIDLLQSGLYEFPLGCENVHWFVDEVN